METTLIAGLGNPGKKYENTRHNAGFLALDVLAEKLGAEFKFEKKFNAEIAEIILNDQKVILAKPQTYMNNSGQAVRLLTTHYKLPTTNLSVVHDEMDLPLGKIRLSENASSAGHKGVQSIIDVIGQDFRRIRIGVNNSDNRGTIETDKYVLMPFTANELSDLNNKIIPWVAEETKKLLNFEL